MAEYWKSTPKYWCKFCADFVKDTKIERKNHEASVKHQNAIQRSLRELHKRKEHEDRDAQRAKDEVARLNKLVDGKDAPKDGQPGTSGQQDAGKKTAPAPPTISAAAQKKAHIQQLIAMGVPLPEELKSEVTGVSSWQTVSEAPVQSSWRTREVKPEQSEEVKKEEWISATVAPGAASRGVHKRKAEDEVDLPDEEAAPVEKRVWGSTVKTYPGNHAQKEDDDLDALLSGVGKKKTAAPSTNATTTGGEAAVHAEVTEDDDNGVKAETAADTAAEVPKQEEPAEAAITAPPPVMFKKRKAKR